MQECEKDQVHRSLQQDGEATEQRTHQTKHTECLPSVESRSMNTRSTAFARGSTGRGCRTAEPRIHRTLAVGRRPSPRTASLAHCAGDCARVDLNWVLCTAWMLRAAVRGTGGVGAAVRHTLLSPLLTDVEREGLRVFGNVGGEPVGAYACICQRRWITAVGLGCGAVGGGLKADA